MVNWTDPVVLFDDYLALIKLDHALAGIYIWETVFTAGFELDVLRRKRPYRWTIWLYLGTRYTALLGFILFLIETDASGSKFPCQPLEIMTFASAYISWAFASLIIVLRVIAIWNRNVSVSFLATATRFMISFFISHLKGLTTMEPSYNAFTGNCVILHLHKSLINAAGILVVDVVLLEFNWYMASSLPTGRALLPFFPRILTSTKCIIWLVLAGIAEVPLVVFLILDLNDPWNDMFTGPIIAIMSIGAARMYRSLCQYGSLTDFVSLEPSQIPPGASSSNPQHRVTTHGPIHFASVTQSTGMGPTSDALVSMSTDQESGYVHEEAKTKD
ncbi:hypothetical protein BGW80DRAFT_1563901 [Lactifluus volemus]|nr:hypothetical protein BGW80DRAFT_1563901 [Lactifluus volemus]